MERVAQRIDEAARRDHLRLVRETGVVHAGHGDGRWSIYLNQPVPPRTSAPALSLALTIGSCGPYLPFSASWSWWILTLCARPLRQSTVLDLSATSGLFAILAEAAGAGQRYVCSEDGETIATNLEANGATARVVSSLDELDSPVDLVCFDLHENPSLALLRRCAKLLRGGGVLAITSTIGAQLPTCTRALRGLDVVPHVEVPRWSNEWTVAPFVRRG